MLTNANTAEMKQEENQKSSDRLMGERKKNKRQRAHGRAHPEALHRKIVDVSAALDRRPEKALETALAASTRIRQAERLHGAGLDRKPDALSI